MVHINDGWRPNHEVARAMYTTKALTVMAFEGMYYQQGISMMTSWVGEVLLRGTPRSAWSCCYMLTMLTRE